MGGILPLISLSRSNTTKAYPRWGLLFFEGFRYLGSVLTIRIWQMVSIYAPRVKMLGENGRTRSIGPKRLNSRSRSCSVAS